MTFHHGAMDFGNDGHGIRDVITNVGNIMAHVGNDGVGAQNVTANIGNNGFGVHDAAVNVGNDYVVGVLVGFGKI